MIPQLSFIIKNNIYYHPHAKLSLKHNTTRKIYLCTNNTNNHKQSKQSQTITNNHKQTITNNANNHKQSQTIYSNNHKQCKQFIQQSQTITNNQNNQNNHQTICSQSQNNLFNNLFSNLNNQTIS